MDTLTRTETRRIARAADIRDLEARRSSVLAQMDVAEGKELRLLEDGLSRVEDRIEDLSRYRH